MGKSEPPEREGYRQVFCRWFIHPKTKKRVYPRDGKCFTFWVKD